MVLGAGAWCLVGKLNAISHVINAPCREREEAPGNAGVFLKNCRNVSHLIAGGSIENLE